MMTPSFHLSFQQAVTAIAACAGPASTLAAGCTTGGATARPLRFGGGLLSWTQKACPPPGAAWASRPSTSKRRAACLGRKREEWLSWILGGCPRLALPGRRGVPHWKDKSRFTRSLDLQGPSARTATQLTCAVSSPAEDHMLPCSNRPAGPRSSRSSLRPRIRPGSHRQPPAVRTRSARQAVRRPASPAPGRSGSPPRPGQPPRRSGGRGMRALLPRGAARGGQSTARGAQVAALGGRRGRGAGTARALPPGAGEDDV